MSHPLSEHIEYLTLNGRSALFQKAIENVLVKGDVVADLGCGVGVLGMQCLQSGASHVYGIDSSDAIHLARESVSRAGLADRYDCIAASTFATDLPQPVDLLICDHIGYFGFDYGIVEMMHDASSRMLKDGGKIIPDRIALQVAGVSSDHCRDKASAWAQPIIPAEFRWLDEYARNTKYSHMFEPEDLCTDSEEIGQIDLTASIKDMYSFAAVLKVQNDCRFDGIAGWFRAHLGGGVWMTNSPLDSASIGRSQAFLPVREPFNAKRGDEISLKLRFGSDGKMIFWTVKPEGDARAQKMSTWASTILSEGDLMQRKGGAAKLSPDADAALHILSLVDGDRSFEEIERLALESLPNIRPTAAAAKDFVRQILARNATL